MYNEIFDVSYNYIKRSQFVFLTGAQAKWSILVPTEGSFRVKIQNRDDIVGKNDLYVFPASKAYERCVLEKLKAHNFHFTFNPDFSFESLIPWGKIVLNDYSRMNRTLNMMVNIKSSWEDKPILYKHCLCDIFFQVIEERTIKSEQAIREKDFVASRIIQFFEDNYTSTIVMNDIARDNKLSPSGLILKIKKVTGRTPLEFLTDIRIEKACRLLINSSMSITEIAYATGFNNGYYFSRAFKRKIDMTPSEYRKINLI